MTSVSCSLTQFFLPLAAGGPVAEESKAFVTAWLCSFLW